MKKLSALLFVLILGFTLITFMSESVPAFGANEIGETAQKYIDKSVNESSSEIKYGKTENTETGSANIVTSIIANYRSFDTLGEVTVLFISSLGVAILLGSDKRRKIDLGFTPNYMLRVGSKAIFGIIIITGFSMTVHGHLTPGGGFPGGAMIAASILLLYLADDQFRTKIKQFKLLESTMGSLYVIIGLIGLFTADYFLVNFLGIGVIGELFSAGIVPIIYVIIGLKVGAELIGIIDNFLTEEDC